MAAIAVSGCGGENSSSKDPDIATPSGVPANVIVDAQRAKIEAAVASESSVLTAVAVTASSSETSNGAANAVDGRTDTRWAAFGQGQYIQIDFGSRRTLSGVSLSWFNWQSRRYTYQLQTSDDGKTFVDIGGRRTSSGSNATDQITVNAIGRYLRVVGYGNTESGDWVSLFEAVALGTGGSVPTPSPAPAPPAEQVPILVTASSSETGNGPAAVIDNRLDTRWATNGQGEYLQFDLGSRKAITAVSIAWYRGNARTYNYQLQVSDDASTFIDVGGRRTNSGTSATLESTAVATEGRYLRVVGYGNTESADWVSVHEVKLFGGASPAPSPGPAPSPSPAPAPAPALPPTPTPTPTPVAYSTTVTWSPPSLNTDGTASTDLSGYRITYGTNAANLTTVIDVPGSTVTSKTIVGLSSGTYYFSVVALNAAGVVGMPSLTVVKTFP